MKGTRTRARTHTTPPSQRCTRVAPVGHPHVCDLVLSSPVCGHPARSFISRGGQPVGQGSVEAGSS